MRKVFRSVLIASRVLTKKIELVLDESGQLTNRGAEKADFQCLFVGLFFPQSLIVMIDLKGP